MANDLYETDQERASAARSRHEVSILVWFIRCSLIVTATMIGLHLTGHSN